VSALTTLFVQAGTPPFEGAGEMAALAGAFAWGTASVLYARSMRGSDALGAVWFKNAVAAICLGIIAFVVGTEGGGGLPGPGETQWLVLSGLTAMCVGDWLYFVAITHIGIGRTVIITMSTPALTALLAWPVHGQTLAIGQWLGVALVVGGGMFAESRRIRPGAAEAERKTDRFGVYVAILCAFLWTAGNLIIHKGLHETGAVTGGAVRLGAGAAGFALWFLLRGELPGRMRQLVRVDSWRRYGFATALGTVFGMWMYVGAFKWAKQGVAASLSSAVPLFAIPLSVWLLGEKPGFRGWIGAAVVMTGVCFVSQVLGAGA
jgi:uncharacterized membrane protein